MKARKQKSDSPDPGVDADDLQRKGLRLFLDILSVNFLKLIALNLLFITCAAPAAALLFLGLAGILRSFVLALSVAAAFPIGGAVTAGMFCVSKMIYGEPGFIWFDFKRVFTKNFRQAAVPGMVCTAFIYGQMIFWGTMANNQTEGISFIWLIPGVLTLLLFALITPYIFLQIAYVDLKTVQICRNSVLLPFAKFPRSLMGMVAGNAFWIIFLLYLPVSILALPLVLLLGFSLSWLLCLMWVWPQLDKQFSIVETLRARQKRAEN